MGEQKAKRRMNTMKEIFNHNHDVSVLRARLLLGGAANLSIVQEAVDGITADASDLVSQTNNYRKIKSAEHREELTEIRKQSVLICSLEVDATKSDSLIYTNSVLDHYELLMESMEAFYDLPNCEAS